MRFCLKRKKAALKSKEEDAVRSVIKNVFPFKKNKVTKIVGFSPLLLIHLFQVNKETEKVNKRSL